MNWSDPIVKKFVYIIVAMIVLCPLGILLVWNYGDAWGEWDPHELAEKVGVNKVAGMLHLADIWKYAPLPDYDIPGWDDPLHASIGYIISAIVGVALCVGAYFLLVKIVSPKPSS
ncbi:PDGLE domain-containing protein [Methanocaldococcus sp.]